MSPKSILTVDIARDRSKTLRRRERKTKNEKKSNNSLLLLRFYLRKFIFCQKRYSENLVYIVIFALLFFHVVGCWKYISTNAHINNYWFFRRYTSIQNTWQQTRLGILTQILITMDYFLYLYIADMYLQFRKKRVS